MPNHPDSSASQKGKTALMALAKVGAIAAKSRPDSARAPIKN